MGVPETPGVILADAGYWHQRQRERAIAQGSQVLVPPDTSKRKTPRPGCGRGSYAFCAECSPSDCGGELYGRRQPMIEPVLGHTKHTAWAASTERGRGAVRTEWR